MGRAAEAPSRRDADSRLRLGVAAGRRALLRRLSTFVLIAVVCPGVQLQAAERLDGDLRERLLQLKQLCDEGLVEIEVCKEKQREILGLSSTAPARSLARPGGAGQMHVPEARHGLLGVVVESVTSATALGLGLAAGEGAAVVHVLDNSPADQAGVKPGDVIVELGGQIVRSADLFPEIEAALPPGTRAPVKVLRGAGEATVLHATIAGGHPPVRLHTSPLGFNVRLPAGWTASQGLQLEAGLEAIARHLGEKPNASAIVDYTRKLSQNAGLEIYSKGKNFISVVKQNVPLPRMAHDGKEMCAAISANRSKATGRRIEVHDCSFKMFSGSPAFCMDHDAMVVGKRTRQCWITNRDKGMVGFTFTFEDKVQELKIAEFEQIVTSIEWQ